MRSQIYAWNSQSTVGGTTAWDDAATGQTGSAVSIFIGGFGNNITKPAETTATQFVVIEEIAATPSYFCVQSTGASSTTSVRGLSGATTESYYGPLAYTQIVINTTEYFLDPDNIANNGVPGAASPYPRTVNFQSSFNLHPTVYVLPGQTFDVRYTFFSTHGFSAAENECFVKYTLYDGPDSLIANKLLELGITVNPNNVDWYKRTLIEQQSVATV